MACGGCYGLTVANTATAAVAAAAAAAAAAYMLTFLAHT
jgi:hypothetical protein